MGTMHFAWAAFAGGLVAVHMMIVTAMAGGALLAVTGVLRRWQTCERGFYALLLMVAIANVLWGDCPLTEWERAVRAEHLPATGYTTSFIEHYMPWLPVSVLGWIGPALMGAAVLAAPSWRWIDRRKAAERATSGNARDGTRAG